MVEGKGGERVAAAMDGGGDFVTNEVLKKKTEDVGCDISI